VDGLAGVGVDLGRADEPQSRRTDRHCFVLDDRGAA
jgi:hypothetical protein